MTKDGLVEQNAVSGESTRISNRQTDIDLRGGSRMNANRPSSADNISKPQKSNRKQAYQQNTDTPVSNTEATKSERSNNAHHQHQDEHSVVPTHQEPQQSAPTNNDSASQPGGIPKSRLRTSRADVEPVHQKSQQSSQSYYHNISQPNDMPKSPLQMNRVDATKAENSFQGLQTPHSAKTEAIKPVVKSASSFKTDKKRLQFAQDEASPAKPTSKPTPTDRKYDTMDGKIEVTEHKADGSINKPDKVHQNLTDKQKFSRAGAVIKKSSKAKSKLLFENAHVQSGRLLNTPATVTSVGVVSNSVVTSAHEKMYEVENENVGTKAAHRTEMVVEDGVRKTYRLAKNTVRRKAQKIERTTAKRKINFAHRNSAVRKDKARRSILKKASQKRKIRRSYAKRVRDVKRMARIIRRVGVALIKFGTTTVKLIAANPKVAIILILLIAVVFIVMSACSAGGNLAGGSITSIVLSTYLAQDHDMLGAEAVYAGMEADLQYLLDNYETLNPGYDEYVFELDSIWHDPYVLMSILHSLHDLEWTLTEVQGTLAMLFDRQYTLTETETVEIRTRIETVMVTVTMVDPETGDEYEEEQEEEVEVEYEYWIMTVTLENANLSHLPVEMMSFDQLSRYATFMSTLGNRPDLFPVSQFPNASFSLEYLRYEIPPEYFGDEVFAAIIAEAEKYLGFPYVWGGSHPSTSFDCSGFVSWVYNQSGWNFGRLGAKALYNISTPISPANAKPGDLVFFWRTYNAPDPNAPTHVGIYVGDGMMLHCGNPIGYVSINTNYWQNHFFGFARP
jgi:hypothetical protein